MTEQFHLGTAMTVSDTQLQTARVSYVTYSKNQLCQLAGWGYGETREREARCSNITVFCKLIFTDFKKMAGTCSVYCKGAKGELVSPHLLPRIWKQDRIFQSTVFATKLILKPTTLHIHLSCVLSIDRVQTNLQCARMTLARQVTWWFISNANRIF